MSILLLAAVLSTQIPERAIDHTWGHLMRARHYAGAWTVEVDGRRLTGEWITIDTDRNHNPRWWGGSRQMHLLSWSGAYCAILLDTSQMHCESAPGKGDVVNLHAAGAHAEALLAGVALERHDCRATCTRVRAGTLSVEVHPTKPDVARAQQVFAQIYKRSLAEAIGGSVVPHRDRLVLRMPYELHTYLGTVQRPMPLTSTEIVRVEAMIELTTQPAATITAREVGRHIEDCEVSPHAATSCMPQPRRCTVRRPDQAIGGGGLGGVWR